MENQPVKFASQQEGSTLLAEKIENAQSQPEAKFSGSERQQLENEVAAGDERIKAQHESAAGDLGSIATGHEVHTDMSGNMLNEKDLQEIREKGPVGVK